MRTLRSVLLACLMPVAVACHKPGSAASQPDRAAPSGAASDAAVLPPGSGPDLTVLPDAGPDVAVEAGTAGVADAELDAPVDASADLVTAAGADTAADVVDSSISNILRFVVVADPQMGMTPTADGSDLDMKYFSLAVAKIGALKPPAAFVLNCGDVVHGAVPNLWSDYLTVAAKLPIVHHEVMGNHDGWSAAGLDYWRNTLGKKDYYAFSDGDALFIALNSFFLKNPTALPAETKKQKDFLAATLAANPGAKHKFLFFHMPIFTQTPTEAEDYWNLPLPERNYLLDIVDDANVTAVFTGHFHRTDVVAYNGKVLLTSGPISLPMGKNSDGTPASRGFFVIDFDRTTGKLDHQYQLLLPSEL